MEYDGQPEMTSFFDDLCFFLGSISKNFGGFGGNSTDVMFGICRLVIE